MNPKLVFKAMADDTRRRILQLVARHQLSVSELVQCLAQPQSTVSRHLKVLRDAALIHDRRDGTTVRYDAPNPAAPDDSQNHSIQARMLDWLTLQAIPKPLQDRLNRVLMQRQDQSSAFFSQVAKRWDRMRVDAFGDAFHLETLAALLPGEWTVADIGTGTGFFLPLLAATFHRVLAVDPVTEMLEVARARCAARDIGNVSFRKGDFNRLPIDTGGVDLACAVLVIHHVPAPQDAVAELARIVKPGGRLLIVEQKTHRLDAFHERMQDRWWGFEPQDLAEDVAAAGFRNVQCRDFVTDQSASTGLEAPELFILTARSVGRSAKTVTTKTADQ